MAVKEITQGDNGEVKVRGYASTPDLDRYRDIVEPEAFSKALKMYGKNPVLLRSHDGDRPIGTVDVTRVTDKGLWIEATIKEAQTAEDVSKGLFKAFSIGYIPTKTELRNKDNEPLGVEDNPWDWQNIRVIKELDLVEISVVSTPANGNALFTLAKSLKEFGRKLAFKAFDPIEAKGEVPENEAPAGSETESAQPADDEEAEEANESKPEEATEVATEAEEDAEEAGEEEKPDETEAEGAKTTETTEDKATETEDGAENADETAAADDAEGGDKPTEEADADATDAEDEDDAAEVSEDAEKTIIVDAKVAAALVHLKDIGAIREAKDGEEAVAMDEKATGLLMKLYGVLESEHKRANEQTERADAAEAKLNATPEKKALAAHRQFGSDETITAEDAKGAAAKKKGSSDAFMALFNRK